VINQTTLNELEKLLMVLSNEVKGEVK